MATKKKPVKEKVEGTPAADMDALHATDRETMVFYKGRHPAFPNSHFYVVKDTNKEISFKKKLAPHHKIGLGYPCEVTREGHGYAVARRNNVGEIEFWKNKPEMAQWLRDDQAVVRENKRAAEQAGLRSKARNLGEQIAEEYKRADPVTKRDIIAAFVEALEA